ncbi:hypothetical protein M0812_27534 [Anaeramoeba flamelloides]|uniref:Uncharacterized protein n=1 Tax=Anaeramoeba flamelloides TaxID=1746091 RepID=A0AAV7Y5J0_9EUKA|nr:hypothetical protein M0812_27534 [Anaeramoeba flamelloides]
MMKNRTLIIFFYFFCFACLVRSKLVTGKISVDFLLSKGEGKGSKAISNFSITNNQINITHNGTEFMGVVYLTHLNFGGDDLYDVVSVSKDGDDLLVVYLYCTAGTSQINMLYYESYDSEQCIPEEATGFLDAQHFSKGVTKEIGFSIPVLKTDPTPIQTNILIEGKEISYQNANTFHCKLHDDLYKVSVFSTVDCKDCPNASSGWYELHSILSNGEDRCFGIFYLYFDDHNSVLLKYLFCNPSLTRPKRNLYVANWNGSLKTISQH